MGCYNLTCYLSNLPITHGDEVVVMPLVDNNHMGEYSTPTIYWAPAPVFFYGEYDDYGSAEECHGSQLEYILDEYRANIAEQESTKEFSGRDNTIRRHEFDIDKLWVANHGNLLQMVSANGFMRKLSGIKNPYLTTTLSMMRKDVFDALLERYSWDEYIGNEGETYRYHNYASLCAEIPEYIKLLKDHIDPNAPHNILGLEPFPTCERDYKSDDNKGVPNMLGMHIHMQDRTRREFFRTSFSDVIKNMSINDRNEELTELLTEHAKYLVLYMAVQDCRRNFYPPSASSQESDADTQIIFAEITKEVGWEMGREVREENEAWDPVTETSIWQEEMQF